MKSCTTTIFTTRIIPIVKVGVEITVSGIVQGVWYRASTKNKANALNISGTVENKPDGSVYIKAYGTESAIMQLIEWCRSGPPHARVDNVSWGAIDWEPESPKFLIKR